MEHHEEWRRSEMLADVAQLHLSDSQQPGNGNGAVPDYGDDLREPKPSGVEAQAVRQAWEHLFAQAARTPFGLDQALSTLTELGDEWRVGNDPPGADERMVALLFDEATDQLSALEQGAEALAGTHVGERAVEAARAVQFTVAQIAACS